MLNYNRKGAGEDEEEEDDDDDEEEEYDSDDVEGDGKDTSAVGAVKRGRDRGEEEE